MLIDTETEDEKMKKKTGSTGGRKKIALMLDYESFVERQVFEGVYEYSSTLGTWDFFTAQCIVGLSLGDLYNWNGDGVIGFIRDRDLAARVVHSGLCAVNISSAAPEFPIPSIRRDLEAAAASVGGYFIQKGYKNFAYYNMGNDARSCASMTSYRQWLKQQGISCHVFSQAKDMSKNDNWIDFQGKLVRWLQQLPKPVAIWCADDKFGARILAAAGQISISMPDQLAVMGWNNDPLICLHTQPTLTSIEIPWRTIGYRAAAMLDRLFAGKQSEPFELIAPERIVERESTNATIVNDPVVEKAIEYIEAHACDPVYVTDVVARLPIGRRQFENRFYAALSQSPNTYILRSRLRKACQLLKDTDLSVGEIAARCGFRGHNAMDAVFGREIGLSPSRYRQQQRDILLRQAK
jgi:LacI family transcriptional regulator